MQITEQLKRAKQQLEEHKTADKLHDMVRSLYEDRALLCAASSLIHICD
jgi:hypothetical protein